MQPLMLIDNRRSAALTGRKIAITLIIPQKGEGKAHTCEIACLQ
jgi:hypothetical protein